MVADIHGLLENSRLKGRLIRVLTLRLPGVVVEAEDKDSTAKVTDIGKELHEMLTGIQVLFEVLVQNIQSSGQTEPDNVPGLSGAGTQKREVAGKNGHVVLTGGKFSKLLKDLICVVLAAEMLGNAPDRIRRDTGIVGGHVVNTHR